MQALIVILETDARGHNLISTDVQVIVKGVVYQFPGKSSPRNLTSVPLYAGTMVVVLCLDLMEMVSRMRGLSLSFSTKVLLIGGGIYVFPLGLSGSPWRASRY